MKTTIVKIEREILSNGVEIQHCIHHESKKKCLNDDKKFCNCVVYSADLRLENLFEVK